MINYLLNLFIIDQCIDIITSHINNNIYNNYNLKVGNRYYQLIMPLYSCKVIFYNVTITNKITDVLFDFTYDTYYQKYNNIHFYNEAKQFHEIRDAIWNDEKLELQQRNPLGKYQTYHTNYILL